MSEANMTEEASITVRININRAELNELRITAIRNGSTVPDYLAALVRERITREDA
jgi:hypothetical protein